MTTTILATRKMASAFALAALVVLTTSATILYYNADFKGEWTFNEKKSKLGEGRFRMNASKLKVTQDGDALGIERTNASPNGETIVSPEKITFDGKASESTVFGNAKKTSTGSWSSDGQSMTINSTILFDFNGNSMEVKGVEVWKLLDDGKTLSIATTTTSQRGTVENTFVYDKK
ncbi:MAG: hypothetical protein ABI151_03180 [Chitinophagaceae bacterium]